MRIGIHGVALTKEEPAGVEEYTWQLLKHIFELPEADAHRFVLYVPSGGGRRVDVFNQHPHVEVRELSSPLFWTQGRLSLALRNEKELDSFFVPAHVLPRIAPARTVVTVHGLEYEYRPDAYPAWQRQYLARATKEAVRRTHRVLVPSQKTKEDLVELYGANPEDIWVVPHGVSAPEQPPRHNPSEENSLLFLGRIEKKKNLEGLLRAYKILREEYNFGFPLILAGSKGFGWEGIFRMIERSPWSDAIHVLGFVSEEAKWRLLSQAQVLVLPSWYEGFGLTILEAQAVGVPVVASLRGSMPEVGGRGALYINPANPYALARAIALAVQDQPLRRELIRLGKENIRRFTWEAAARATLAALTSS